MAKRFTPMIGLAVVVALAMVAVFGAMSLTPNPAAADSHLESTAEVGNGSITVKWDIIAGLADDGSDVEARWREPGEGYPTGSYTTAQANDDYTFTPGNATEDPPTQDMVVMAVDAFRNGRTYIVQVRVNDDNTDRVTEELSAIPNVAPTGGITTMAAALGENKGEVDLTWGYIAGPTGVIITGWEVRYRKVDFGDDGTVDGTGDNADVAVDWVDVSWMAFDGADETDADDEYEGTVSDLMASGMTSRFVR